MREAAASRGGSLSSSTSGGWACGASATDYGREGSCKGEGGGRESSSCSASGRSSAIASPPPLVPAATSAFWKSSRKSSAPQLRQRPPRPPPVPPRRQPLQPQQRKPAAGLVTNAVFPPIRFLMIFLYFCKNLPKQTS